MRRGGVIVGGYREASLLGLGYFFKMREISET